VWGGWGLGLVRGMEGEKGFAESVLWGLIKDLSRNVLSLQISVFSPTIQAL